MGLPVELQNKIMRPGQTIGLWFKEQNQAVRKSLKIIDFEYAELFDFSLGSAAALNVNGTGWSQIQDSSNRYLLQPPQPGYLYQYFWGANPGYAWIYRAYPANITRGGLLLTPTIGGGPNIGFDRGWGSPYMTPGAWTETFITNGLQPAYLGYHPYGGPASITVYMNFWVYKYQVQRTEGEPYREVVVGGSPPVESPQWLYGPLKAAA